jgi:hypothetical protein
VSAEMEARLRAALHAYADQVEESDDEVALPERPARTGAVRRWRSAVLVAAAVAAVSGGTVWVGGSRPGEDVTADQAVDARTPESGSAGAASAPESAEDDAELSGVEPYASAEVPGTVLPAAPAVGVPFAVDLLTHCGVLGIDVGGTWFAADPPLVEGAGNPPPGWGNPYQPGTLTLTSPDDGVFTDDIGHEVVLRAAPESARPDPCD